MRMPLWLEKRAALTPDRTALIGAYDSGMDASAVDAKGPHANGAREKNGPVRVSFGELRDRSRKLAQKLIAFGVHEGDIVAVLCRNGLHVSELIHAVQYAGAVYMPLNIRLTVPELAFQIRDSGCRHLIYDEANRSLAMEIRDMLPGLNMSPAGGLPEPDGPAAPLLTEVDMEAVSTIMYTSGTTGTPKGVMLTYGNHWASAVGSVLNLGWNEHDVWLACVPLFHISGLSIMMRSVIYGMPVVIHEKFDPEAANRAIFGQGVTMVSVVSNMLSRMIEALGDRAYPAHFRCMLLGGGPAPLPLLEACRDKNIPVFQTYGMTETASQIVTLPPEFMLSKLGSAGKPLFQSELKIVKDGKEAAPFTEGEIVVRGPNVTKGYLNRPDATADAIRDGWLHTGDIGYVDEDGFLYVLDRRKDLIISGGENVYPAEIETVLLGHPAISDAGVTGVEDARWGQVPVAFVKLKEGATLTERDLLVYCTGKLAKYKIPARVFFVDRLPRNASNKLLRRDLLAMIRQNG